MYAQGPRGVKGQLVYAQGPRGVKGHSLQVVFFNGTQHCGQLLVFDTLQIQVDGRHVL